MDSLTQIVLGAAVGEVVLGKKVGNKAMLWGAIAGTIPDLDVAANFFVDSLTATEMHRAFTHSILFSVLFAPVLGFFISKIYKSKEVTKREWSWLSFWALFTHPILDCHTTFGTQLLWPLPHKLAFNNIFVVDPLYTIPFLVLLIIASFYKRTSRTRRRLNWIGIGISSAYLIYTLYVKLYVHNTFEKSLVEQNISYNRISTIPTPFNSILWTGMAETDTSYYTGSYSLLDKERKVDFIKIDHDKYKINQFNGSETLKRLKFLSKDWYTITERNDTLIFNDIRFGPFYRELDKPEFMFGWELHPKDGDFEVERPEPPRDEMSKAMKVLYTRLLGK